MATTSVDFRSVGEVREHPVMRWGAVWAGWFVATGTALGLYAFGLAIGFSAINPNDPAAVSHGINAGTIVWLILTWGASLWIGAMFASWFDGRNDTEMGVIRGLTVWGLSMAAAGLLVTRGVGRIPFAMAIEPANVSTDPTVLTHYLAAAMWTAFGCIVISLLTSAFGGWLGARHVQHVYHLRKYTPHGQ